jgi:hypothetical protein
MVYVMASTVHYSGQINIAAWIMLNGAKHNLLAADNAFKQFVDDLRKNKRVFRTNFPFPNKNIWT